MHDDKIELDFPQRRRALGLSTQRVHRQAGNLACILQPPKKPVYLKCPTDTIMEKTCRPSHKKQHSNLISSETKGIVHSLEYCRWGRFKWPEAEARSWPPSQPDSINLATPQRPRLYGWYSSNINTDVCASVEKIVNCRHSTDPCSVFCPLLRVSLGPALTIARQARPAGKMAWTPWLGSSCTPALTWLIRVLDNALKLIGRPGSGGREKGHGDGERQISRYAGCSIG
jgi:hypothetical protein